MSHADATVANDPVPAPDPAQPARHPSDRLPRETVTLLTVLLVGAFVVILNETAMNVALASIMHDLQIDERAAQWLTTGFMLTMAVVIPTTGWLLQRFSTRAAFTLALAVFSIGTLACALAFTFPLLLAGRIIQATGTAIMMPLLMTTVMDVVPAHMRGRVMGTISLVIAVAPAIGPTVSGVVLQFLTWRFVFVVVLPIALGILALGLRFVRNVESGRPVGLDMLSVPLAAFGFGGLVYGLSLIGDGTVPTWRLTAVLGVGLLSLLAFGWRQVRLQRTDAALLDLRTFTQPAFALAVGMLAIMMVALFGSIIALPLVLQQALHLDPLGVGLLMLPGGVLMGVLGPLVGRLYDLAGPRWLLLPGGAAVLGAFALFAQVTPDTPWPWLMAANLLLSLGFAFMMTPLMTTALGSLPHQLRSYGSAVVGTVQQVAGAAGTALFVTVMTTVAATATGTPEEALTAGARAAFTVVGAIWLVPLVAAGFLKKPADTDLDQPLH
ncbi:MAG: MDR family MFS transporter [Propionicimonas sp.]|nr:MDR family MFS transporter [Propionicimonas sp.]